MPQMGGGQGRRALLTCDTRRLYSRQGSSRLGQRFSGRTARGKVLAFFPADVMTFPVAIDLSRLLLAPFSRTPRGIDRVDLGYARHFFGSWSGKCVGTVPTPWGIRWVGRRRALRVVDAVEELWREVDDPEQDPSFVYVRNRLLGRHDLVQARRRSNIEIASGYLKLLVDAGLSPGRSVPGKLMPDCVYINTGQLGLGVPQLLSWIARRPDVRPVFMLHDVIPLEHAEYVTPGARAHHARMIASAALHAAGVVTTTAAASEGVRRELVRAGCPDIPVHAVPLPVSDLFLRREPAPPMNGAQPYFVCCGAIEPRKNHILLLNIWREMARTMGPRTPKLVIVGSRNRADQTTVDMLERCEPLKPHLIEVTGLSTPSLKRLLQDARGLLMPSFTEGFGLPVVEALTCGTPVLASDIAAHREVGGDLIDLVSPIDGAGWLAAITTLCQCDEAYRARKDRLAAYRPWTWQAYFAALEPFMRALPPRARGPAGHRPDLALPPMPGPLSAPVR